MAAGPKPFDLLRVLGRFGAETKLSLRTDDAREAFNLHVQNAMDRALGDPVLLHGQRTEAMFEALLVSLNRFQLLVREDGGQVYPADLFIAPDFRVVLNDGAQWLIEVKNVYMDDPAVQSRELMTPAYHAKLRAYAEATGAELKLAIYWAKWSLWTLVSPDKLMDSEGGLTLDMMQAVKVNELARLGDLSVSTCAPLRFQLLADPERTSSIGADGTVSVVFGASRFFSQDREILDPRDQEIAWMLMLHGQWQEQEMRPIIDGDRLVALEFTWAPVEESGQGFDTVGPLSRLFAHYYSGHTLADGEVVQLIAPPKLGWFEPLQQSDYRSDALPLWRFTIQPNYD